MKKTDIVITICLDDNKIPEKMSWSAKDGGVKNPVSYTHLTLPTMMSV